MATKLTEDLLRSLGFRGEGKDIINRPAYRLKVPWDSKTFKHSYHFQIQVVLGPYPDTNPNSGIVSLYDPEMKDQHCIASEEKSKKGSKKNKIDFLLSEDDTHRVGYKYITFPERCIPIAWHVATLERLNQIYVALTRNPPLKPREIKSKSRTTR